MSNKAEGKILLVAGVLLVLGAGLFHSAGASEIFTLFTTPAERQIINVNRYKSDKAEPANKPVNAEVVGKTPVQQLFLEEVSREYRISAIAISRDGPHTVWINAKAYEDGEQLDDNSKIKIFSGDEIRVRITAPDGKAYFARSGETLEITYLAPVGD